MNYNKADFYVRNWTLENSIIYNSTEIIPMYKPNKICIRFIC